MADAVRAGLLTLLLADFDPYKTMPLVTAFLAGRRPQAKIAAMRAFLDDKFAHRQLSVLEDVRIRPVMVSTGQFRIMLNAV